MVACLSRGYSYSVSDIGINCRYLDIKFNNMFTDFTPVIIPKSMCASMQLYKSGSENSSAIS